MKTVFDNSMVAHVWAAQTQPEGRSQNGNFYFNGAVIYSYGRHFPVGVIRSDCVLLNSDSYGNSTARHKTEAYRATLHLTQFFIPGLRQIEPHILALSCADPERHESARKAIVAHVRNHMSGGRSNAPDGAAIHLLTIARVRDPESAFTRMVAQALRAAAKKAAREAKAEFSGHLAYAARIAKTPASELAEWRDTLDGHVLIRAATHLHHAHRAAVKAGRTKQAADVWALLKGVRGRIATRAARAARRERNAILLGATSRLRGYVDSHADGNLTRSWDFQKVAETAACIAQNGRALGGLKVATFEAIATAARAERDRLATIEQAAEFARQEAARTAWLDGTGPRYWHGSDSIGGALLRVVGVERVDCAECMGTGESFPAVTCKACKGRGATITSGELQTSHGAAVPLIHAIAALRFIRAAREHGRPWARNGSAIRVGHFQIDSIDAGGNFKAGCHQINWPEIDRIATQLGL